MRHLILFLLFIISGQVIAQLPTADVIKTSKGSVTIQPIMHATFVLTWKGKTIYIDPTGTKETFKDIASPDVILITDIHGDHFNVETLTAIKTDKTVLIAPKAVADKLPANLITKVVVLNNGQSTDELNFTVKAIPMYNLPEAADARHTKGRGNGYVLTFGNKVFYISGDTAGIPEMRALKNIDVAFVCMNLPYTMDVPEAADAVLAFKPKIVYPYHYRGQNGLSDTAAFKTAVNEKNATIDVRLRNWYPN